MEVLQDRGLVIKALVGSHNYNLNTASSDTDYKYFVLPTFNDLYTGTMYSFSEVGVELDYTVHDARKLNKMLWQANINFIEILFSVEYFVDPSLEFLHKNRERIAKMNLPYLYDACVGMHFQKMGRLGKTTESTKTLVCEYGYNTKEAIHAYRVLDFLIRYHANGFSSFGDAIWYSSNEKAHALLLGIKAGKYTREEFNAMIDELIIQVYKLKDAYKNHPLDEFMKSAISTIITEAIRGRMREELCVN